MAKRKHTGTVVIAILVAILLAVGVSGWLFWQSVQRVIGEAQQAGEYAAEAQQSVGQGDFKQALEQMDSAGSHIVAARDETQGMLWQAAEYVLYYGSDVKAVRGMLDAAADAATNALPKIDSAAQGTLVDFNIEELLSGHELLRRHAFHSQNRFHQAGPVRRRCGLEARQDVDSCAAATPHGTDHRNGQPGQAGSGPNR